MKSRGRQNLIALSFMILIAGMLLMIGSEGANIIFFIGFGLFATSFIGWLIAIVWKISVGIDTELGKHLD